MPPGWLPETQYNLVDGLSAAASSGWMTSTRSGLKVAGVFYVHISDFQLMLPEGIRRDNNKMYEEVEIPANAPMSVGFQEKPIYISDLDEVRSEHVRSAPGGLQGAGSP